MKNFFVVERVKSLRLRSILVITGSAVELHCCSGRSEINRKMVILTPGRIATPQHFILKFGTRDYILDMTPHANFGADRFPKYVKYNTFVTFLDCPNFFSILCTGQTSALAHTLNRSNDVFRARRCLLGVGKG